MSEWLPLQNVPLQTPEGKRIREAFVAEHRPLLLPDADYSQVELRLALALVLPPVPGEVSHE